MSLYLEPYLAPSRHANVIIPDTYADCNYFIHLRISELVS